MNIAEAVNVGNVEEALYILEKRIEALEKAKHLDDCGFAMPEEPKKIDMTKLSSDIDCVFLENGNSYITQFKYITPRDRFIKIRENHWHHWNGGECPLPDGLRILCMRRDGGAFEAITEEDTIRWKHKDYDEMNDIIAFKVLGVDSENGWEY